VWKRSRRRAGGDLVPQVMAPVARSSGDGEVRETRLGNGLRVLTEAIPGVRSATAGVWVRQGAAHESSELAGISHVLEHMVFKGTTNRDPREIALALERLGGSLDAFTSREHTSFQARVLAEHLPIAVEVLGDLVGNPLLREEDLELEREVILEEIATVEDTPDDLVFDLHGELLWGDHPYGRPILGSPDSLAAIRGSDLRDLHRARYVEGELVVAAAGFLDHDSFVDEVQRVFGGHADGRLPQVEPLPPPPRERERFMERDTAQTHLVFGVRTPPRSDPARLPLTLLSTAFGGGMGSRLFQRVREELGLAYSVYSFHSFHSLAGVSGVYVGTRPEWRDRAVDAVRGEFAALARAGLDPTEVEEVRNQVKGQIMLSLESTGARLYRLAGFAIHDQPILTLDELLASIDAITIEELREAAERWFRPEDQCLLELGPELR